MNLLYMTRTINCIIVDDEPAARDILTMHIGQIKGLHLIASCKNALEAYNVLNAHHVDLVFLDIKCPGVWIVICKIYSKEF